MKAEEFLISMWNKCILFRHIESEDIIYMIYDKQHMRKMKLNSLDNIIDVKFIRTNESKLLFCIDYKSETFYVNNIIWSVLQTKYNNYNDLCDLIKTTLLTNDKLNKLSPIQMPSILFHLTTDNKLKNI